MGFYIIRGGGGRGKSHAFNTRFALYDIGIYSTHTSNVKHTFNNKKEIITGSKCVGIGKVVLSSNQIGTK